ncbi:MAG: hypothetical protein HYV75_06315, partial [Opitutae bacterium]|nr:hypothetical protein [Opitutae bacterium]
MRSFLQKTALVLVLFACASARAAQPAPPLPAEAKQSAGQTPGGQQPATVPAPVWECRLVDFSDADYRYAVEQLLQNFEDTTGRKLVPGVRKKVGLKIYSDSGPGLATPFGLVRALISS